MVKDKFPGFTVYDAETGEPMREIVAPISLVDNPLGVNIRLKNPIFCIDTDGDLFAFEIKNGLFVNHHYIQKEGKYIIQLGTGEKYKW